MASYHPSLTWPRSDGDVSTFPSKAEQVPSSTSNWWELLDSSAEKYKLYEERVGKHVAEKLKISAATYRMPLPDNYAIFAHHKPQGGGNERVDCYLFGSPHIGKFKFRSTNEFLPHVDWLFNTNVSLDDHSTCPCIYNKSSELAKVKKAGGGANSPAGPSKRPLAVGDKPIKRARPAPKKASSPADDDDTVYSLVVRQRELDTTTGRRFRKGELVWFRIPTVDAPAPPDLASSGLPSITHWPGLVAAIDTRTTVVTEGGANMSAADAIMGVTRDTAKTKEISVSRYSIRPLGVFNPVEEVQRVTEEMLPWALGNDLLNGQSGWERVGMESTRIITDGVRKEVELDGAKEIDEKTLDKRWKSTWLRKRAFEEYFRSLRDGSDREAEWDGVVYRLGLALKTAASITNSWTQTDKIEVSPDSEVNKEDLADILAQTKTLYQGLWWGGERIWMEDMVRLRKERSDLPSDALSLPSDGANDRAVFLRIRMITIEVSPDSTSEVTAWRCLLYGDLFELARAGPGESSEITLDPLQQKETPMVISYAAPKGYVYRQLNGSGSEVTVDIMDVAGRMYPDLLDCTTQTWFSDPNLSAKENEGRRDPGDPAKALTGLLPGTQLYNKSEKWKEDLYKIVTEATKSVERDMRKFYDSLLKKHGVKIIPSKEQVQSPTKNGASGPRPSMNASLANSMEEDMIGDLVTQPMGATA